MTIFKNNEKPNLEDVVERLDRLEKRDGFLVIPVLYNLLDEGIFPGRAALGTHPLSMWLNFKLYEPGLPDEQKEYLEKLKKTMDFSNYRSLRR